MNSLPNHTSALSTDALSAHYLAEAHEWLNRCSTAADIRALTDTMRQQVQTLMEYPSRDAHAFGRWLEALAAVHGEEVITLPMYKAS